MLVGSSGLFGFETQVPALTEDIDVAVPEATVTRHGREIVEALQAQGFEHQWGTASFIGPDNAVFDLLGHGDAAEGDHTGGTDVLRVMVFEDLSRLLATPQATMELPSGGRALTPASFVFVKLLTERPTREPRTSSRPFSSSPSALGTRLSRRRFAISSPLWIPSGSPTFAPPLRPPSSLFREIRPSPMQVLKGMRP